jgi:hypothetical protein
MEELPQLPCCLSMLNRLRVATSQMVDKTREKVDLIEARRLKALADHDAGATSTHDLREQGNLHLYNHENLSKRIALRQHPRIVEILEVWWRAAKVHLDEDGDDTLDFEEYCIFHDRLVRGFRTSTETDEDVHISEEDARVALEEDWAADNRGDGRVDKDEFFDSVFQLADAWCETVELQEHCDYLKHLYARVWGGADKWRNLRMYKFHAAAFKKHDERSYKKRWGIAVAKLGGGRNLLKAVGAMTKGNGGNLGFGSSSVARQAVSRFDDQHDVAMLGPGNRSSLWKKHKGIGMAFGSRALGGQQRWWRR